MGILGKCGKIYESNKYILNQRIGKIRAKEDVNINFLLTYLNSDYQSVPQNKSAWCSTNILILHILKKWTLLFLKLKLWIGLVILSTLNSIKWEADEENENLVKLRDTLLPKLLSGELHIPDAAAWAEGSIKMNFDWGYGQHRTNRNLYRRW